MLTLPNPLCLTFLPIKISWNKFFMKRYIFVTHPVFKNKQTKKNKKQLQSSLRRLIAQESRKKKKPEMILNDLTFAFFTNKSLTNSVMWLAGSAWLHILFGVCIPITIWFNENDLVNKSSHPTYYSFVLSRQKGREGGERGRILGRKIRK